MSRRGMLKSPRVDAPSQAIRRDVLGQMGAALLLACAAAGPAKAAELDGELLALVDEYVASVRDDRLAMCRSVHLAMLDGEPSASDVLLDAIGRTSARTPEGLRAKLRAVRWSYGGDDTSRFFPGREECGLMGSLLADLTAVVS